MSIYSTIALSLATVYLVQKPLSAGLFDTSIWISTILAPPELENNASTKQFLKIQQAALMDGWLGWTQSISLFLFLSSIITGFLHSWWLGIIMYLTTATGGIIMKLLFMRPLSHYVSLISHKMVNRAADYKWQNDTVRFQAAESLSCDLMQIIHVYKNSQLRPPTEDQLKKIPYGNLYYWIEHGSTVS